jgi:hypothetical protein
LKWAGSIIRDCQGFQNPPWVRGRVSEGKGMGCDFPALAKSLPWAGVKGIYNNKTLCKYHIYLPQKSIFLIKNIVLACKKLYYKGSECYSLIFIVQTLKNKI